MCDVPHLCICVTWLIHTHVWQDSYIVFFMTCICLTCICVIWLIQVHVSHLYASHDQSMYICEMHVRDMTYPCTCATYMCVTWLIHVHAWHACVWHDSFMYKCDNYVWHDSSLYTSDVYALDTTHSWARVRCMYVPWLIHVYLWHDLSTKWKAKNISHSCVIWSSSMCDML